MILREDLLDRCFLNQFFNGSECSSPIGVSNNQKGCINNQKQIFRKKSLSKNYILCLKSIIYNS